MRIQMFITKLHMSISLMANTENFEFNHFLLKLCLSQDRFEPRSNLKLKSQWQLAKISDFVNSK
jgi:hypothetical protein